MTVIKRVYGGLGLIEYGRLIDYVHETKKTKKYSLKYEFQDFSESLVKSSS